MKIGELRNRVQIQQYIQINNEMGEGAKKWVSFQWVWAKIDCLGGGREQLIERAEQLALNYEIIIRYIPNLTTSMRVVYKNKIFDIDHIVNEQEQDRTLHLFCTLKRKAYKEENPIG